MNSVQLIGTGTSQGVPIIGCNCSVCISADPRDKRLRTSCLIKYKGLIVLIDPGPDFRQQALRYGISYLDFVIITHEHRDHIGGLDDLRSFNHITGQPITLTSWPRILNQLKLDFGYAFTSKKYPGAPSFDLIDVDTVNGIYNIFILHSVLHYKLSVMALQIGPILYATDLNILSTSVWRALEQCSTVVIDCLQLTDHISHLTLSQVVEIAELFPNTKFILTHISHKLGLYVDLLSNVPHNVIPGHDGMLIEF